MTITIVFPKTDRTIKKRLWYASGYGDVTDDSFTGRVVDSASNPLPGTTLFHCKKRHRGKPKRRRWLIQFSDAAAKLVSGAATLYVKGSTSPEVSRPFKLDFTTVSRELTIDPSIADKDDITDEADAFVAFGTETDYSVTHVTMNDVSADFIYDDIDVGSWAAQFPPLLTGTYTLLAVDANNGSVAVQGLTVKHDP